MGGESRERGAVVSAHKKHHKQESKGQPENPQNPRAAATPRSEHQQGGATKALCLWQPEHTVCASAL